MKKNAKPVLTLTTETVRALDATNLAAIAGAAKPTNTWALGCMDKTTSNRTALC